MVNLVTIGAGHWVNPDYVVCLKPHGENGCELTVANGQVTEKYTIGDIGPNEMAEKLSNPPPFKVVPA